MVVKLTFESSGFKHMITEAIKLWSFYVVVVVVVVYYSRREINTIN